ncbi:hypothetical protein TrVE_jg8333 [Triparma verrucosa]|uniref:Uncharacterized protein n=1 Tax=Triparma verrucosa TaxID=1606542 RepID=A0A9W7EZ74_9STRA|nr:hypothetical protein TrVE_jg8333 [Triparma verrucosa]
MNMLSETLASLWTLIGYLCIFLIPLLFASKSLREMVLAQLGLQVAGQSAPPQPPTSVPTPGPAPAPSSPNKPAKLIPAATPPSPASSDEDDNVMDPTEWIIHELRNKVNNNEELDDEFVMKVAGVLKIDKDMVKEAYGKLGIESDDEDGGEERVKSKLPPVDPSTLPQPSSSSSADASPPPERFSPQPLDTNWVKDLLPDGQESQLITNIHKAEGLKDADGNALDYSEFDESHVIQCLNTFKEASTPEEKRIEALVTLSCITETTEPNSSGLGRREKHANQVKLLNAVIQNDGLAAIHDVQGGFTEQRHRILAAHVLAKIASKIYEGWN